MSHSKQTANYGLPLFEPKDRPAWLTDFNGAMTAVDATVKGLADSIQAGGLPVTGGTMQGSINMGDHAITNVQEVELQGSGDGLYIGSVVQPNGTSGARLTGVAGGAAAFVKPDSQSIYVPVSVGSPSQDKHAATKEYVDTAVAGIPSSGITQEQADARYLQLSGGTMTGDLKVQESPASAASAVSKSYAQGLFASALPKSGGTMTGPLVLSGAPTADNQAATKAYVDDKVGGEFVIVENTNLTLSSKGNTNLNVTGAIPELADFTHIKLVISVPAPIYTVITIGKTINDDDSPLHASGSVARVYTVYLPITQVKGETAGIILYSKRVDSSTRVDDGHFGLATGKLYVPFYNSESTAISISVSAYLI